MKRAGFTEFESQKGTPRANRDEATFQALAGGPGSDCRDVMRHFSAPLFSFATTERKGASRFFAASRAGDSAPMCAVS